jgi:hypothetical protein
MRFLYLTDTCFQPFGRKYFFIYYLVMLFFTRDGFVHETSRALPHVANLRFNDSEGNDDCRPNTQCSAGILIACFVRCAFRKFMEWL